MPRFITYISKLLIYQLILLPIYKAQALDINKINEIILEEHNKYRKIHGSNSLKYDKEIMKKAQTNAQSLASNSNPYYLVTSGEYSEKGEKYGENLFQCQKKACKLNLDNWTLPTNVWYNEIVNYNFSKNESQFGTHNFTQMIWKNTKKMGCGIGQKEGTDDNYKIVCFYYPRGNVYDKYGDNVFVANNKTIEKKNTPTEKQYEDYNDYISDGYFCFINLHLFIFILCFLLFL